jgi:hypothetical protein
MSHPRIALAVGAAVLLAAAPAPKQIVNTQI